MKSTIPKDNIGFLQGGGEMGELIRNYDWEKTSLGKPEQWPLTLRAAVGIVLHSGFPMFLFWGKDLLCFYNDAYRPSLGIDGKHPLIGKKAKDGWAEIWEFIHPLIEQVFATGASSLHEDQLLPIYRNGKMEDVYWTFTYSPAYGDEGRIEGVYVTCSETTAKVKAVAELHESKKRLEFAIDAADLGTWELDPLSNTFTGNARLKEWFGLEPEHEIELPLAINVIAEKDRARVSQAIAHALSYESGGRYDIEYTIQNPKTGKEIIVKAKGRAYFNENKQPYTFNGTLQDVTAEATVRKQLALEVIEQKLIREKVQESEAHLQLLRDTVPAMIFYLDTEQRYQSYNGVFRDWFKVKDNEAIGKTTREFIGEAAYERVKPYLTKAYAGEQVRFQMHAPSRISDEQWLDIVYTPDINSDGKVKGIIVHAMNITQSKQTELSLRNSELFALDVINNSPVAKVVYTGEEMIVSIANENMLKLIGRDASIIGKPFTEVIPELAGSVLEERMRTVFQTGETFSQAEEQIDLIRFGVPYSGYYNYVYKALRNASGSIYGIMATATEVTEQVVARKMIEGKEKELRDLIIAAPIGICVVSGNPLRAQEVNERFLFISGKTREQYATQPYWTVFSEVADLFQPILENVIQTGVKFTTEEYEMTLIRDGKEEKVVLTFEYIPLFDIDRVVSKVLILAIEVTHQVETRKQIEQAVTDRTKELAEANRNLKRSNAELEQFAYIASHDLQEPVRKISTFTQMLEHSIPELSEKSKGYINKIYSSTDRMANLIRDVLAFSTIAHATEAFEAIDLSKTIDSVKADFELKIEKSEATIEVSELPVIYGIPSQMSQLFGNLVSNSLKYTRPGIKPVIVIRGTIAKKEKIEKHPMLDSNKTYHHIQFSDNGIGFDQEHLERIFRIFQRLHGKNEFEGTGIGLSICKKIVQSHNGHIAAAKGENGGAVFNILLPALN